MPQVGEGGVEYDQAPLPHTDTPEILPGEMSRSGERIHPRHKALFTTPYTDTEPASRNLDKNLYYIITKIKLNSKVLYNRTK